jgi:hypothetical protein
MPDDAQSLSRAKRAPDAGPCGSQSLRAARHAAPSAARHAAHICGQSRTGGSRSAGRIRRERRHGSANRSGIAWRLRSRSGRGRGLALQLLHARKKLGWKADGPLAAQANYFRGNDPRLWHASVPLSPLAREEQVLPGIDWVVYGHGGDVEYDLVVSPGSPVSGIRFRVDTTDRVRVDAAGDILVGGDPASGGSPAMRMHRAVAYQEVRGERMGVDAAYELARDGTLGFVVGAHDPQLPLVIDPCISITYDSFLGIATEYSTPNSVALDASGNLYVCGTALTATTAYGGAPPVPISQLGPVDGADKDIVVAKINPNVAGAMSVIYIAYIGGTGDDECGGIAVDSSNSAAIVGSTTSLDFPTAGNATQASLTGTQKLAIMKLDPTGSILQYSPISKERARRTAKPPWGSPWRCREMCT